MYSNYILISLIRWSCWLLSRCLLFVLHHLIKALEAPTLIIWIRSIGWLLSRVNQLLLRLTMNFFFIRQFIIWIIFWIVKYIFQNTIIFFIKNIFNFFIWILLLTLIDVIWSYNIWISLLLKISNNHVIIF